MTRGAVMPLRTFIEAKDAQITVDMVEGIKELPLLIQDFRLKIPIQDLADCIIQFQREFDKPAPAKHGREHAGGQGLKVPPPPPPWPPESTLVGDEDDVWETLPDEGPQLDETGLPVRPFRPWPREHTWGTCVMALQPALKDYGERTMWHRQGVKWHLLGEDCLLNFNPIPTVPFKPDKMLPSDMDQDVLVRNAATMRTPPIARSDPARGGMYLMAACASGAPESDGDRAQELDDEGAKRARGRGGAAARRHSGLEGDRAQQLDGEGDIGGDRAQQ